MNDFRCMCAMWSRITPFVLNFEYQKSTRRSMTKRDAADDGRVVRVITR